MADLQQLLRYFERGDVEEVVLQSGAPVVIRQGGRMRQLSSKPMPPQTLVNWIRGTPVASAVPPDDTSGRAEIVEVFGQTYSVVIARHGELLQIRFRRADLADLLEPDAEREPALVRDAPRETPPEPVREPRPPTARQPEGSSDRSPGRRPATSRPRPTRGPTGGSVPAHIQSVLRVARELSASDVHLVAGRPVGIRVAGELEPHGDEVSADAAAEQLLALVGPHRAQLDELGYCDFASEIEGAGRLRININRQRTGYKGCFRLVAPGPSTLEELGLPGELTKAMAHHQGLVVVAGPNGQGKTTTLAALVQMLNETKPIHIITVEDPVEIVFPRAQAIVTQREVGAHTKSFQRALEAALREDPDVIVIGELRDRETVEMALSAAETGHLVIATMSSPSGAKTIDRLIDLFPPDDQSQVRATLAGALKAVISQRLVPTVDGRSRVAAAELITGNVPLWTLIRDDKLYQLPSLLQRGKAYGMIRIEDSLSKLIQDGFISEATARHYADDAKLIASAAAAPAAGDPATPEASIPEPAEVSTQGRGGLRNLFRRGSG